MKKHWLIKSCKRTGFVKDREGGGRDVLYYGIYVTESVLTPKAEYTELRFRFWAKERDGLAAMRGALENAPLSEHALLAIFRRD